MSAIDVRDLLKAAGQAGATTPVPPPLALGETGAGSSPDSAPPPPASPWLSPVVLAGCVRLAECGGLLLIGFGLHLALLHGKVPLAPRYPAAIFAVTLAAVGLFQASGCYRIGAFRHLPKTALKLVAGWSLAFLMVAAAMVLAKVSDHYSRVWLIGFFAAGLAALMLGRAALASFVRVQMSRGRFDRRTAIVGGGAVAEELIGALHAAGPESGIRIVGVFDDRGDDRATDTVAGYPKLGNVSDLVAFARRNRVDLVVFTLPISAETRILQMLAKLSVLPVDIRLSAHATKLRLRPRAYSYLGSVPLLDVFDKPLADWDVITKGLFDRFVGFGLLLALSPVMLGVALAVRLTSPGPVLFRQKRYGFNNELIEVFKFRSMYVDQCDAGAARLVTKTDSRVTPVGRFIRKTSLDELPQLFNVIRGDLSLVGPRPHALQAKAANTLYDQVVDGYFARHKVKPGITGWAQINGWRGETDTSEKLQRRVEHDLHYIENWSILFDLKILATTPLALLKTDSAY
ncbi:undecaprenyl-phosphate glucose phosphotransferase [Methylorubrum salsuginis]|uniref:Undecaprenyl-phosphate glucose phosphotransferase n=1 Tax=Methylorubrum salsuginis TaxID=414703 RepID=A0A1I4H1S3_9HYPH|nr:undecaprenyl-phosphate glucose phosphotransferase [Methylorubrum salsuginis]SFL36204.1 Undecaprenyl-phosphate glucose phosphotransferase [Methylorubrum salsuginis]